MADNQSRDLNNDFLLVLTLPLPDASRPVILSLTSDAVTLPGRTIQIECLAEGAPMPIVEVQYVEYSDLTPLEVCLISVLPW